MLTRRVKIEFTQNKNLIYLEEYGHWKELNSESISNIKKYTNVSFENSIEDIFNTLIEELVIEPDDCIEIVLNSDTNANLIREYIAGKCQFRIADKDLYDKESNLLDVSFDNPHIVEEPVELTDEFISSILHINKGETKRFEYNNIHFGSYVNCEGDIEIDNCILYYNEKNQSDEITLSEGANLKVTNSYIICKGFDENHFITCSGNNNVVFENTTFVDCAYFLNAERKVDLTISKCELNNCFVKFITAGGYKCNITVIENVINQNEIAKVYIDNRDSIHCTGIFELATSAVQIKNNTYYESEEYIKPFTDDDRNLWRIFRSGIRIFDAPCANVENSTFTGLSNAIKVATVSECGFKNCLATIDNSGSRQDELFIDNCLFENCTNVIVADDFTKISNCQFISCYNSIIKDKGYLGGISVEFCEFVEIKNEMHEDLFDREACIEFDINSSKEAKQNSIKNCMFKGVDLEKGYLIAPSGYADKSSKTVCSVEKCVFNNIATHSTTRKMIREYVRYDTLMKKNQSLHAIILSDCKINETGGYEKECEFEKRTVSTNGNIIGSSIALGAGGLAAVAIGGPVGLITYATETGLVKATKLAYKCIKMSINE